jgi:Tol biopolymer transport system component
MKLTIKTLFIGLTLFGGFLACRTKQTYVSYPAPLPDSLPISFMPDIVTSNELDFNSAYSPDGKSFYFGRSKNKKWVLYVTTFNGVAWSKPMHPAFNDTSYSEADPVFAPDGNLYYISSRPKDYADTTNDFDIWLVKPEGSQWSEPVNLSIANSDSNEFYISFAANRNLYFSSSKEGGFGQEDIYMCAYENNRYTHPVNLGQQINSPGPEHDPLVTRDERYLIFTASERKDSFGEADLYFSKRNPGNEWQPAANLGKRFNTSTYEYCSYLSPDDQYFFYSSESDIKWVKAEYLIKDIEKRL